MSSSASFTDFDKQATAFTMEEPAAPKDERLTKKAARFLIIMSNKFVSICKHSFKVTGGKPTLSIGLFPSTLTDKPDRQFHWDIIMSERSERRSKMKGTRFRVKPHPTQTWVFEAITTDDVKNIPDLLARIIIADVTEPNLAERIISSTPMLLEDPEWRCHDWVADALSKLTAAGCITVSSPARGPVSIDKVFRVDARGQMVQALDWPAIMRFSREYVEAKIVAGRYTRYENLDAPRPTYSMLAEAELWE